MTPNEDAPKRRPAPLYASHPHCASETSCDELYNCTSVEPASNVLELKHDLAWKLRPSFRASHTRSSKDQEVEVVPRRNTQNWEEGSVFLVPLSDGDYGVGQVIARERELLNSVAVALYDQRLQDGAGSGVPQVSPDSLISLVYVTRDLLNSGRWKVVGKVDGHHPSFTMPFEHLRGGGFIGARVQGSAITESFLNAFYGLEPWDDWYLPDFLDGFLVSPDKKPHERLLYCGRHASAQPGSGKLS